MPADPWSVVSVGGGQQPPQPPAQPAAPAGGGGEWDVVNVGGQQPAPQPQPGDTTPPNEDSVDAWLQKSDFLRAHPLVRGAIAGGTNLLAGIGAGATETLSGADVLARKGIKALGGSGELSEAEKALQKAGGPTQGKMQAVGKGIENVGEFFTGEELLGMLGRSGMAMSAGERLKNATQIASLLEKNPYIAKALKIGMETVKAGDAARAAAIGGGQEYLKSGGDVGAATKAGLITGATAGVMSAGASKLGNYAMDLAPTERTIEGVTVPVLKSQVSKGGEIIEGGDISQLAPDIAQQQQQGARQIMENVAARAANKVLSAINDTRATIVNPERILPAPEGSRGFQFDLGGADLSTTEVPGEPPMVQRATSISQRRELGSLASTVPGRMLEPESYGAASATGQDLAEQEARQSAIDQETIERIGIKKAQNKPLTPQERTEYEQAWARESTPSATNEPEPVTKTGGAGLMRQTDDPVEAAVHARNLRDQMQAPEFSKRPVAEQNAIKDAYQNLSAQLSMYHASPYRATSAPIDINAAMSKVHNWGQAGDTIISAVRPTLQKMNAAAGGRIAEAESEMQAANDAIHSAKTAEDFDAAVTRFDTASSKLNNFVKTYGGNLSAAEAKQVSLAVDQGTKMQHLHAVFEHMMNGVTQEETTRGFEQVMTGNARDLQSWLAKPENAAMLDDTIGQAGRDNLKRITLLMSKVAPQRHAVAAAKDISGLLEKYSQKEGLWHFLVEAGLMHVAGVPKTAAVGIAAGITGRNAVMRFVLRQCATNPKIGNMLTYAVENNIRPGVFAPMIADAIIQPFRARAREVKNTPRQPLQIPTEEPFERVTPSTEAAEPDLGGAEGEVNMPETAEEPEESETAQ